MENDDFEIDKLDGFKMRISGTTYDFNNQDDVKEIWKIFQYTKTVMIRYKECIGKLQETQKILQDIHEIIKRID